MQGTSLGRFSRELSRNVQTFRTFGSLFRQIVPRVSTVQKLQINMSLGQETTMRTILTTMIVQLVSCMTGTKGKILKELQLVIRRLAPFVENSIRTMKTSFTVLNIDTCSIRQMSVTSSQMKVRFFLLKSERIGKRNWMMSEQEEMEEMEISFNLYNNIPVGKYLSTGI